MNMGERFAMPIYPAAMSALALPTTGPAHRHHTRHAASALSFASAALALIASFLPLYSTSLSIRGFGINEDTILATATAWGLEVTGGPTLPDTSVVPMNGYPLVVACFMLIAAAVVTWFATTPGAAPGTHRAASMSVGLGAAFLLGTAWTVALQSIATIESATNLNNSGPGIDVSSSYEVGHWLLLTAALLGVVATVLVLIPVRDRTWAMVPTVVDPNMATPPYGFALPMEGQPGPQPTVDPLTGLPSQIDPLTGFAVTQPPLTGQPAVPYTQSPPTGFQATPFAGPPSAPAAIQPPIDPNTGLPFAGPASLPGAMPAATQPPVDPNTGLAFAGPSGGMPAVDSSTGLPASGVPATGMADGSPPVDPATGMPVLGPIVIPDPPPPAPHQPAGPAIPPIEDPLAEPRRD
jgi:hypothetical protein